MQLEVIREDETGLARKRWCFYVWAEHHGEITVKLNHYAEEIRESTRKRKWSAARAYATHNARRVRPDQRCTPTVPDDVRDEVKQRLLNLIVFKDPT